MFTSNIQFLDRAMADLADLISWRFDCYFANRNESWYSNTWQKPDLEENYLTQFTIQHSLTQVEYFLLLIALMPHVQGDFFDQVIQSKLEKPGDFPQLGGIRGTHFRGFLPTGETALFILGGEEKEKRLKIQQLFDSDHFFSQNQILWLEKVSEGEPRMSGKIILAEDYIDLLTTGKISPPRFSMDFPAKRLITGLDWDDLVLNVNTLKQLLELENWINYNEELMNNLGMKKRFKPGFRVLFYGPPGTGKTLTATLLGKKTGKEVYRVDLSMVVSKFIGETEKNLSKLFAKAENKDWILFFDEADALFGKRTNIRDAHDKHANQEVAYLLQRVEEYDGLVILASNLKSNIDDAFLRRFQSIIFFPQPKAGERLRLWKQSFPEKLQPDSSVDLNFLAKKYDLSGANIVNIVQFACLRTLADKKKSINQEVLMEGIGYEFAKEGKIN